MFHISSIPGGGFLQQKRHDIFNPPRTRTTTTSVRETRVGAPLKVGVEQKSLDVTDTSTIWGDSC